MLVYSRMSVMYDDLCVVMTENVFMLSLCSHMYIMSSLFSAFLSPALSDHSSCDNQGTQGCITCKKYERRYMDIHRGGSYLRQGGRFFISNHICLGMTVTASLMFAETEKILTKHASILELDTWKKCVAQSLSLSTRHLNSLPAQETHHHWVRMKSLWVIK